MTVNKSLIYGIIRNIWKKSMKIFHSKSILIIMCFVYPSWPTFNLPIYIDFFFVRLYFFLHYYEYSNIWVNTKINECVCVNYYKNKLFSKSIEYSNHSWSIHIHIIVNSHFYFYPYLFLNIRRGQFLGK